MNTHLSTCLHLCVICALSACGQSTSSGEARVAPEERPGAKGPGLRLVARTGAERTDAGSSSAYQPVHADVDSKQRIQWGDHLGGPRKFSIEDVVKDPSGQWQSNYNHYSASFDILDVASKGKGSFFVLGSNFRNGVLVHIVESWETTPKASLFGTPATYELAREELYRDVTLGEVRGIEVDPEGRFLLVTSNWVGNVCEVTQMALPSLVQTTVVAGLSDVSEIYRVQHATLGRLWVLHTPEMDWVTILYDQTNDGVFESTATYDYDTWEMLQIYSGVTDNFLSL